MINVAHQFPPAAEIVKRISACYEEIAALKRVLRAAKAAEQAEEAKHRRRSILLTNSEQTPRRKDKKVEEPADAR